MLCARFACFVFIDESLRVDVISLDPHLSSPLTPALAAGFTAVIFIATLIYFPSRPPNAPSRSANTQRESFVSGLKQLMRHRQFWLIAFAYGIMTGTYSGWGSYLEPNLQSFLDQSKAQDESGWLGFYGTIAGCVGAIGLGMFADTFAGKMKV